jgi:hypothetical protein
MASITDHAIPVRQPGPQPGDNAVPRSPQLERYAELLWSQQDAAPAWSAQRPAVQETYRRMAKALRATVLAEVMARPGDDRARQEITRLRAELVEERARLADQVERLEDHIRELEWRLGPDTAIGLQPGAPTSQTPSRPRAAGSATRAAGTGSPGQLPR